MELGHITYVGPEIDDEEILEFLPENLRGILREINGFIQYQGGFHLRGACSSPRWHSLRSAWTGETAFHRLYESVHPEDVPFAQDCVGDQFVLRDGKVLHLYGETGEIEKVSVSLAQFLGSANEDPVEYLGLHPLIQFHNEGGELEPGKLIHAFPPFCMKESGKGVSLRAVPAAELLEFHADIAAQLPADGEQVIFRVED